MRRALCNATRFFFVGGLALLYGVYKVTLPRSIRNKNPLNIREAENGGAAWNGELAYEIDSAFEEFEAPEYGYRAAVRILRTYRNRSLVTVRQIIEEWAPGHENDTESYIRSVLRRTGFQSENYVVSESEGDYPSLLQAMAIHETGAAWAVHPYLQLEVIKKGQSLA